MTRCVRANKFWGWEGFLPDFPQICPKRFCTIFAYKFSHKNHEDLFLIQRPMKSFVMIPKKQKSFDMTSKKCLRAFKLGTIFLKSKIVERHLSRNLLRFSQSFPGFSTNQLFLASSCTPYTPASYTTAFDVALAISELPPKR